MGLFFGRIQSIEGQLAMSKYHLSAKEFAELSTRYEVFVVINYAYGLRLLQLCIDSANDIYAERLGFEEFIEWLDDLSQHVDEGFECLERYIESQESGDDLSAENAEWDTCGRVDLAELQDLMKEVGEGLDVTLQDSAWDSGSFGASSEEERFEEEVASIAEKVIEVGYETYHFLIGAQTCSGKLDSSDGKPSGLLDVSCMFGNEQAQNGSV
jgi:hypothetical protein